MRGIDRAHVARVEGAYRGRHGSVADHLRSSRVHASVHDINQSRGRGERACRCTHIYKEMASIWREGVCALAGGSAEQTWAIRRRGVAIGAADGL